MLNNVSNYPLAFSQVREDPQLDLEVLDSIQKNKKRVLMISSGGDTLCRLAASPEVKSIDAVDANPAQLLLSRLKLQLLSHSQIYRSQLLGHSELSPLKRKSLLEKELKSLGRSISDLCKDEKVFEKGPDFSGRYEILFEMIQQELQITPEELSKYCGRKLSDEFKQKLKKVFDKYFDLQLLVEFFGPEATQNPLKSFREHFYERTVSFIESPLSARSPFLFQMLTGSFPGEKYQWLQTNSQKVCDVEFISAFMGDYVRECKKSYDFIHLSNILDWLSEAQAEELLRNVYRLLAQGGKVIIRQLNSSLDIKAAGSFFTWENNFLERIDLSFFYREIHVGGK